MPLKELRFSKDHLEVLELLGQGKTLTELQTEARLDRSRTLRLLYSLALIGAAIAHDVDALGPTPKAKCSSTKASLADGERRVAQKVIDGEKLGEGSRLRIGRLRRQNRIAQPRMGSRQKLSQKRLVKDLRRLVQAQP